MDGEALITGAFQRGYVPSGVRVARKWFQHTIAFDEPIDGDIASVKPTDRPLEPPDNGLRRACFVKPFETGMLDGVEDGSIPQRYC